LGPVASRRRAADPRPFKGRNMDEYATKRRSIVLHFHSAKDPTG
jgi:hypothetical protein